MHSKLMLFVGRTSSCPDSAFDCRRENWRLGEGARVHELPLILQLIARKSPKCSADTEIIPVFDDVRLFSETPRVLFCGVVTAEAPVSMEGGHREKGNRAGEMQEVRWNGS